MNVISDSFPKEIISVSNEIIFHTKEFHNTQDNELKNEHLRTLSKLSSMLDHYISLMKLANS